MQRRSAWLALGLPGSGASGFWLALRISWIWFDWLALAWFRLVASGFHLLGFGDGFALIWLDFGSIWLCKDSS